MDRKHRTAVIAALASAGLLLGARPVLATATLSCDAGDKSMKLSVQAVVGHGAGESLSGFQGEIGILLNGVPDDLRKLALGPEHLTQHWVHGRAAKLRIYRERPDGQPGDVEIVRETRAGAPDEPEHRGTYVLTVQAPGPSSGAEPKTLKARGRATCSVG
jgi:hypothetical protein